MGECFPFLPLSIWCYDKISIKWAFKLLLKCKEIPIQRRSGIKDLKEDRLYNLRDENI